MTVDNVKALSPFGTVQGSQTSAKPDELVQERFDKLMSKMGDQLAGMQKTQAAVQAQAPKQLTAEKTQPTTEKAQESAQPKEAVKQDNAEQTAETKNPEDAKTAADSAQDKAAEEGKGKALTEKEDGKAADAATQETVEEAAGELVAQIVDVMQIPLEKVEEAMEILGLTAVQLFDPANLKQLLLQLSEAADELTLVTDETLYGNLQELFTTVNETLGALQEELGLTPEELEKLVADMSEAKEEPAEDLQPDMQTPVGEKPEVSVEGMKDYAVSVAKDGGTVQIKVTVDDASGEKHVSEQVTQTTEPETDPIAKKSGVGEEHHRQEDSHAGEQSAGSTLLQHLTGQTGEVEAPVEQPVYTQPDTNQIMDQIVEYMKINIKPETQEMEMQLHPASLGSVHVQIAAKDGVITAQFAAQNETVKAVLETQMIQLKQQFEEQGIKVEAVEVTVANHSYGEQYSDGQDAADQGNEGAKKNGTRRINLDDFEEEALEELDDSERIAVEMMQANGSTIDYTA